MLTVVQGFPTNTNGKMTCFGCLEFFGCNGRDRCCNTDIVNEPKKGITKLSHSTISHPFLIFFY